MHKGKDGHVCQLCGPGITHLLPGHAKQIYVQQCKVPARVEKKKVEAPKSSGEEKRCSHPGLYQVEQAKREDVV
jgi:hypothetical protein